MKTLKNKIAVALSALFLMGVLAGCNKTFIDTTYPTLPDELKQTLTRIMEERRYGVFG